MKRDTELEAELVAKYAVIAALLKERARRLWATTESRTIGYGIWMGLVPGPSLLTFLNARQDRGH